MSSSDDDLPLSGVKRRRPVLVAQDEDDSSSASHSPTESPARQTKRRDVKPQPSVKNENNVRNSVKNVRNNVKIVKNNVKNVKNNNRRNTSSSSSGNESSSSSSENESSASGSNSDDEQLVVNETTQSTKPNPRRNTKPPAKGKSATKRSPPRSSRARTVGAERQRKVGTSGGAEFERGDARRHFKEGQTKICPPMGDGGRAFYETLLQENPQSLIATRWLVERGCLVGTQLKEVVARYYILKDKGAYKLSAGGIKPQFCNGIKSKTEKMEPVKKASSSTRVKQARE